MLAVREVCGHTWRGSVFQKDFIASTVKGRVRAEQCSKWQNGEVVFPSDECDKMTPTSAQSSYGLTLKVSFPSETLWTKIYEDATFISI